MICLQLKPHFQAASSCKGQQDPSASEGSSVNHPPKLVQQPLSYAEYIVQSKGSVVTVPKNFPSRVLKHGEPYSTSSTTTDQDSVKETDVPPRDLERNEELSVGDESCPKSDPSLIPGPKPVGSGSSIIVSPRQVCGLAVLHVTGNCVCFKHDIFVHHSFLIYLSRGGILFWSLSGAYRGSLEMLCQTMSWVRQHVLCSSGKFYLYD